MKIYVTGGKVLHYIIYMLKNILLGKEITLHVEITVTANNLQKSQVSHFCHTYFIGCYKDKLTGRVVLSTYLKGRKTKKIIDKFNKQMNLVGIRPIYIEYGKVKE